MRIVLATPLYPPDPGGPATYTKLLEDELPRWDVAVDVVTFGDVRNFPKMIRHFAYALRVWKVALRADLVYALDPISTGLPALVAARLAGKPFYLRVAGDYAWEQGTQRFGVTDILDDFVKKDNYVFQVCLLKRLQTIVARSAKRVVVPSIYLKRMLVAWGVDERKIAVVYNTSGRFPERSTLVRPQEVPKRYVTTVARLVPWKGIAGVIRAIKLLEDEGEDIGFVVVGSGPEEANLKRLVEELGIIARVIFIGPRSRGTALAYVAHAEAFVLNTKYEGFSHVILEAFALRTPVLTTSAGGNPEVVEHQVTGLVFPFDDPHAIADAIRCVLGNVPLREKIVHNASARASTFTRERVVEETLAALEHTP